MTIERQVPPPLPPSKTLPARLTGKARARLRLAVRVISAPRQTAAVVIEEIGRPLPAATLARRLRARAVQAVATGGATRPDPGVVLARDLRQAGRVPEALAAVDTVLARRPRDLGALKERQQVMISAGSLTGALATARRVAAVAPTPAHRVAVAQVEGRLRELRPDWYPPIASTVGYTSRPGVVLHLLKESLPYHERGYTMRSRNMLRAQHRAGFEPVVVTSLGFPRLDGHEDFDRMETIEGVDHFRLDLGPDFPYRTLPFDEAISWQAQLTAGVVEKVRPALIHANSGYRGFEAALVAIALGRRYSIPVVYDVRSFLEATWTGDVARSQTGEHFERRRARELACMTDADLVFTLAESMRDDLLGRGVDPSRIVVIPNAVDVDEFTPRPPDADLTADLGLGGRFVLGYISNLGRREGLDVLIDAVARLARTRPEVAGLIVGDGPEIDALRRQVRRLHLTDTIRITGPVPHHQIQRYYSLIDLFVIPRRDDEAARWVTPLKPFEAMAMRRPLLVADLPALREVVSPPERGLTFEPEDAVHLAATAARLMDDEALRQQIGAAGRAWVERERTWTGNGARYVQAYGRLGVEPVSRP